MYGCGMKGLAFVGSVISFSLLAGCSGQDDSNPMVAGDYQTPKVETVVKIFKLKHGEFKDKKSAHKQLPVLCAQQTYTSPQGRKLNNGTTNGVWKNSKGIGMYQCVFTYSV